MKILIIIAVLFFLITACGSPEFQGQSFTVDISNDPIVWQGPVTDSSGLLSRFNNTLSCIKAQDEGNSTPLTTVTILNSASSFQTSKVFSLRKIDPTILAIGQSQKFNNVNYIYGGIMGITSNNTFSNGTQLASAGPTTYPNTTVSGNGTTKLFTDTGVPAQSEGVAFLFEQTTGTYSAYISGTNPSEHVILTVSQRMADFRYSSYRDTSGLLSITNQGGGHYTVTTPSTKALYILCVGGQPNGSSAPVSGNYFYSPAFTFPASLEVYVGQGGQAGITASLVTTPTASTIATSAEGYAFTNTMDGVLNAVDGRVTLMWNDLTGPSVSKPKR